jgi:OOP family OmpA-OmpF porin
LLVALAAFSASPVHAQWEEWYVTPAVVYNDDDPKRRIDDGLSGFQVTFGRNFGYNFAFEGAISYADIDGYYLVPPGVFVRDNEFQTDIVAKALAFYDRDAAFAPYAMAGIGYLNQNINVGGTENNPTGWLGGGFKWRMGSSDFSLRTEVSLRYVHDGGGRSYNDYIANVGLEYRFGGARVAPTSTQPTDTDGDGVLDMWDECPDTAPGVDVNARGCEIQDMTRDTDGDRVPDYRDECPNTMTGAPVDARGCTLDSDMDGVLTGDDRCPGSRPNAVVDRYGCELRDDDNDNVTNNIDQCPNTRRGANVDQYGCEIREVISLPGVNFQSGSDLLVSGAERLVQEAAETLKMNPGWLIEVAGHTDSVGNEVANQGLSDRRAKTVYDFLIKYGVEEERLTFRGYGETSPIASNDTASGRAMNRRVELRVAKP